ncbi:MAG: translocation and assembly module TamB [Gemmatimonadaceae bacterium]|jgi:autotransporter translocation and assembly factor TamB|nr:translocation and assembly module TamB [Gemmatimonadaceae bacterium]
MTRRLRIVLASAIVLVGLGVILILSVIGVTHTGFGQDRVRGMVMSMLAGQVKGKVYIGRMSGGFFNGVTIDSVEIRDDEDSVFVASGPIRVSYDPRDLFDRRILLSNLQVQRPVVHLRQHANGDWNWRRIFPASVEKQKRNERGFGEYVVIDSSQIHDATFTLTIPWRPADSLRGAQRDSAIRFELTRSDHEIRRTREGFARTWRWTRAEASVGFARIADPDTVGRLVRVKKVSFTESDPPFKFRNISGTFLNLGDSIFVDAEHWDLPRSTGRAKGSVVWGSDLPIRYYVHVTGDSVALSDVAWVYPTLPTTGGGKMELDIRSERDPRLLDYVLTKMDVRTTGSRLLGQMTFSTGASVLAVKNVDLQATPVDFDLLRTLNGKPFPYDWQGKLTGNVKGAGGPLNHFRLDESSLTFADAHVPGAITTARGEGELDILFPAFTAFHDFHVDVGTLDLRTLQYLNPLFPKIKGTVSGTAALDSSWLDVRFRNADLYHHDGAQPVSHVTGDGRVTWGKYLIYDLALQAQPLSFTALSHSYPLLPLRGSYAGPIQVKGTSPNLLVNTALTGPAGTFGFNGLLDADPLEYAARGRATTTSLDLRTLLEKDVLPHSALTGVYDLDLRGESLPTLKGSAVASIERSTIAGFRVDPSVARVHLANGVATVDTLALNATGLRANASGTFGLTGTHTGTLKFSAVMDSLSRVRALVPSLATNAAVDSLLGSAELTGELSGSIDHLALNGIVRANDVMFGTRGVENVRGSILLADVTKDVHGSLIFGADTVKLGPVAFQNIRASVALLSPTSGHFSASMLSQSGVQTEMAGNLTRSRDTTIVRLDSAAVQVDSANRYRLQYPTRIQFSKGFLALDSLLLQHSSKAKLVVENVRMNSDSIKGHVRTDSVDLRLVRAFVPGLVDARGAVVADVDIRGSIKQPQLFGQISLADGFARFSNLGTSYNHITADIALAGDTVHIRKLSAETVKDRRGTVSVTGTVSFEHYDNPSFSLTANASNFHAIDKPGLAALDISTGPPVTLTGSTQDAVMRGSVRVERGTIYIPDVIKKQIIDLSDPEFQNIADTLLSQNREVLPRAPKAVARNLRLENVTVDIGPDVWLRSSEANVKLGGSLNVTLAPPNPGEPPKLALEGLLSADKGTYRLNLVDPFIQPTFDVQNGSLRFSGTSDLNPSLDITAIHTVRQPSKSVNGRDVRVEVDITGTLAQPKLALKNPDQLPLSESDLLSYLVTGEPAVGLDNTTGQVAGLGVRTLGNIFTNAIPRQLLDIVELQTAVNTDPTAPGATSSSPYFGLLNTRAVLGKQLGSRWFLGLSTGLCFVNPGAFKENLGLQLEYRISSLYSAQAAIEPGSSNTRCDKGTALITPTQTPSQLGFDLFRNWRF